MTTHVTQNAIDSLKTHGREPLWRSMVAVAQPTASLRAVPDYLVVGAQRSGTTAIQTHLRAHPDIRSARLGMKGVHYFDTARDRDLDWYRSHYPTRSWLDFMSRVRGKRPILGEASPYYLFHPAAAERIGAELPNVKVIVLVRNPVERAISHYFHEVRRGDESLGMAEAFAAESTRLAGEEQRMLDDPAYNSFNHQHYSYVARGMYASQIRRLQRYVSLDRLLVVESEAFFTKPAESFRTVLGFLGAREWEPETFPQINAAPYADIDPGIVAMLEETFAAPNRELVGLLGTELSWT